MITAKELVEKYQLTDKKILDEGLRSIENAIVGASVTGRTTVEIDLVNEFTEGLLVVGRMPQEKYKDLVLKVLSDSGYIVEVKKWRNVTILKISWEL